MQRTVSAHLEFDVSGTCDVILAVAVAAGTPILSETMSLTSNGRQYTAVELFDRHGARLHRFTGTAGAFELHYHAVVAGIRPVDPADTLDLLHYLRPSRFAESDQLRSTARQLFGSLSGQGLVDAVTSYVFTTLSYVPGASGPGDSAVTTLESKRGVCRDYAHLVIALLRACDVPARMASAYAPGLKPMDFHALAEAWVDGAWQVVDATRLAPRQSLVRIATGRDASDVAFLTNHFAGLTLTRVEVGAVADVLPRDDHAAPVFLA
ncbi:transglutaminase-like domain-containing protein [Mycetocola zhadangensis]|uniref:Transglutaminase family protein n=1 Tax=Mycetocola zhadangensis TaxID=1164595 RepID=A0A3L7ITH2_9MICO|nr:transglutaminase family protein [Mycetocola zhadangensis]RLQ81568.1 transglutaminase family protein [Mycetocola zhadangensis]GGF01761.1 putative transglutaminase-like protein [Mycetocola zhadangensis]